MNNLLSGVDTSDTSTAASAVGSKPSRRASTGFTIIELLLSVALLIALTAISIPSLASVIQNSQLTHSENQLLRSLAMARTAAMSQAKTVVICPRDQTLKNLCGSKSAQRYADWSNGWIVFVDLDNDGQRQELDELISVSMPQYKMGIVYNQTGRLRFNEMGRARSAGFYLCGANSRQLTHIKVLHSGRYRSALSDNPAHLKRCKSVLSSAQNSVSQEG